MIQEVHDDKFIVVRKPSLQEDEGNYHVLAICDTRTEVAEFSRDYEKACDGYFHVGQMLYVGSHFSGARVDPSVEEFLPENIREYCANIRR